MSTENFIHIGERIKYIREHIDPKMSQAQLGHLAFGITNKRKAENFIKYIEGRKDIYFSELVAIAKAFRLRYYDLVEVNHNEHIKTRLETPLDWKKFDFPKKS